MLLSDSDISPRLHRLTAHRLKPYISHTPPFCTHPPKSATHHLQPFKRSNMPSTQTLHAPSHPSLPLAMPGKQPYYSPPMTHQVPYARPIISPQTPGSSVNTSAVPSLTSGSQTGEDNVPHGASGIDLVEMLNDRLSNAVDTLPLDRSLVRQAQTWAPQIPSVYPCTPKWIQLTTAIQFGRTKCQAPWNPRIASPSSTSSQSHPSQLCRWRASRQRS